MPWLKMDDQFIFHEKARLAGKEGRNLYVTVLCYCANQMNDGLIHEGLLPTLFALAECDDGPATVERLLQVRLWERVPGGYQVHDYLDYNPSREAILKEREAARKRKFGLRSPEPNPNVIFPVPGPVPVVSMDDVEQLPPQPPDDEPPLTMSTGDQQKILALLDVGINHSMGAEFAGRYGLDHIKRVIAYCRGAPGLTSPTALIVKMLRSGEAIPGPSLPANKKRQPPGLRESHYDEADLERQRKADEGKVWERPTDLL